MSHLISTLRLYKRCGFSVVILLVAIGFVIMSKRGQTQVPSDEKMAIKTISRGSDKFALNLYQELAKEAGVKNIFVSPFSLQSVLVQLYSGAAGSTAEQIAIALGLPSRQETLDGYSALLQSLKDPSLAVANRLFVEATMQLKYEFQTSAEKYFKAKAESVSFNLNPEKARSNINNWVKKETHDKIQDLLAPGIVTSNTRLVLVNAIHFKADWLHTFNEAHTQNEPFHVTADNEVTVKMMHIKKSFGYKYHKDLGAQLLELPYKNDTLHMIVILPDAVDGLSAVEEKLSKWDLADVLSDMNKTTVNVAFPSFKIETTMELNDIVQNLGMTEMFNEESDLSGMSDEQLSVSTIIQKAFIEVNERGTEAAAATGGVARSKRSATFIEDFYADHPFALMILHRGSGHIVFLGEIRTPISI